MAEFLTTNGTSHWIENIMIEAKKNLVLVSPYLQISKTFFERLKDASDRGVDIKIIYGKDDLKPNEKNSLADLKKVELYYFENLHAKCYFNESKMVITSMNMYEFSEKNNREMGVLIDRQGDKDLFDKATNETLSILRSAETIELVKQKRAFDKKTKGQDSKFSKTTKVIRGYCIRCEDRIPFNPAKPLCESCYMIWAQYSNDEYIEDVCHRCGEFHPTTMAKPLCRDCFDIERGNVTVINTGRF